MKLLKFKKRITDIWDYPKLSIYNNQVDKEGKYFDYLNEKSKKEDFRLYIHIPYCNSFCAYCQFYKEAYAGNKYINQYFDNLIEELKLYSKQTFFKTNRVASIFFGGGDPSIIQYNHFERIMECIYENYNIVSNLSISVEGNVLNLLDEKRLSIYKKYNVSRLSFGVQTFNERLRHRLSIKPSISDIYNLVEKIKKYKFASFAFDMMYDLPDQTDEDINSDVQHALELKADYIDFYSLNLYPNTNFYKDIFERGKYEIIPTKERELSQNRRIHKLMKKAKHQQVISCTYSNKFDIPHPGLYHYLKGGNMLGVGPSARSFLDGYAYRNVCSIEQYINLLEQKKMPIETGMVISNEEIERRKIILGVNLLKIDRRCVEQFKDLEDKFNMLVNLSYVKKEKDMYVLTEEGRAWVGNIQKVLFSKNIADADIENFLKAVKEGRSAYNQDFMSIKKLY